MVEIEDARLARVAQRRFGVQPSQIAQALERVEQARSRRESTCLLRELVRERAISGDTLLELIGLRERARPGGMKLTSILGSGASATVYAARDAAGNEVAVKLFKGAERDLERAKREEDALTRLDHPAIPRFVASGEVEGRRWLAIEKLDGESLSALVRRRRQLPWPWVVEIGLAVARALGHCHRRGILHQDVKPANVVLSSKGAFLVDFGLSAPVNRATTGRIAGTPGFIAPEQARGGAPTARGDVYSLGAVLFQALTGAYPQQASTAKEALLAAADPLNPTRPLAMLRDGLPAGLIFAVERALEKDPALRFQSAEEMAEALARVRLPQAARGRRDKRKLVGSAAA